MSLPDMDNGVVAHQLTSDSSLSLEKYYSNATFSSVMTANAPVAFEVLEELEVPEYMDCEQHDMPNAPPNTPHSVDLLDLLDSPR